MKKLICLTLMVCFLGVSNVYCQAYHHRLEVLAYKPQVTVTSGQLGITSTYPTFGKICKIENRQDAKSKIALRARLGTLDYCNRLEGK